MKPLAVHEHLFIKIVCASKHFLCDDVGGFVMWREKIDAIPGAFIFRRVEAAAITAIRYLNRVGGLRTKKSNAPAGSFAKNVLWVHFFYAQ